MNVVSENALVKYCKHKGALTILDSGFYIAVFYLPRAETIRVGKLGNFHFKEGMYFYVGSAQRNLSARLKRHSDKKKPFRWHIDYLSARAMTLGAITIPGSRKHGECELARELGNVFKLYIPGFGASDCRCGGHLFFSLSWSENTSRTISYRKLDRKL